MNELHGKLLNEGCRQGLIDIHWMLAQGYNINEKTALDVLCDPSSFHWPTSPVFDSHHYTLNYPDVVDYRYHPVLHFIHFGQSEGRKNYKTFDPNLILENLILPVDLWIESHQLSLTGAPLALLALVSGSAMVRKNAVIGTPITGPLRACFEQLKLPCIEHTIDFQHITSRAHFEAVVANYVSLLKQSGVRAVLANSFASFCVVAAAHAIQMPCTWIIHEPDSNEMQKLVPDYLWPEVVDLLVKTADCIFVSEQSQKVWLNLQHSINSHLIPKALLPKVQHDRTRARASFGCKPDDFLVLSVGTFSPRKGQLDLVEAISLLAKQGLPEEFMAVFVGFEPSPYGLRVQKQLRKLRDDGLRIKVFSQSKTLQERDRVEQLFAAADIFVMTSRAESLPLTTSEALAAGCPVISTNLPGIADLIAEGQNGLYYVPGDSNSLATHLRTLFENSETLSLLRKGIEATQDDQAYQRMIALYESVLNRGMLKGCD